METTDRHEEKFKKLLYELFQFDSADLDFGIYRIMNEKRDVIKKFIQKDLSDIIAEELSRGELADQANTAEQMKKVTAKVEEILGRDAIDGDGNLDTRYHDSTIGQRYLKLVSRAVGGGGASREALTASLFNHLYAFFSRYYNDGDFISQRRYSRRERYAIPYNGEEVHLHWANSDQYYIKTAEHFHDYTFTSKGVNVHFKLTITDVEQNNVTGDKRFFLPQIKDIAWHAEQTRLVIPFEYRPLTKQENITYTGRNQQDAVIAKTLNEIFESDLSVKAMAALRTERHKSGDGRSVTFLEHHLRQYTRRNTSDFFIHKDLKGFLSREIDFYLKNEILNLDETQVAGENLVEGWFQLVRTIKAIGSRIIEFLDQVERFQKKLWEKRKFVMETQYCITIGNIDERIYPDIAMCRAQWQEWQELFHIRDGLGDLFSGNLKTKKDRIAFMKSRPTLVLDTKHFDSNFVDSLLSNINDLDEQTDGLLINSENWQALNLLTGSYQEQIKCIYIDPPYNTASSEILYKNNYKHSSWITLVSNRIEISRSLLSSDGISIATIDHEEFLNLGYIKDHLFGKENRLGIITIFINPKGRQHEKFFSSSTEYMLVHAKDIREAAFSSVVIDPEQQKQFNLKDTHGKYRLDHFARIRSSTRRELKPNFWYPIYVSQDMSELSVTRKQGYYAVYPRSDGDDYSWKVVKKTFEENLRKSLYVAQQKGDEIVIYNKFYEKQVLKNIWTDKRYFPEFNGTQLLKKIFGKDVFTYPKSIYAVSDAIKITSTHGDIVLDYFAGSGTTGHAIINLNRDVPESTVGPKRRKFILVEMGKHFDTVILPRIKKVTFSPAWKNGKPERTATQKEFERGPHIIKYLRLESYEDALNNLAIPPTGQGDIMAMGFEDYLLKYMLEWETKRSKTFLNIENLTQPFDYRLHVHANGRVREKRADPPETFNYLLGLRVQTRRAYNDDGRRYLVYQGRVDQRQVVVIWRDTEGWQQEDLERDKKFVTSHGFTDGADDVFMNGDSFVPGSKPLDPVFKTRMFADIRG